jgi:hypothetical protein
VTDYKRLTKRELLIALRERLQERKRIITLLMAKADIERARGTTITALGFDQLALELGQMGHEPVVVEAARAKGITQLYTYVDKETERDHGAEHRRRRESQRRRAGGEDEA